MSLKLLKIAYKLIVLINKYLPKIILAIKSLKELARVLGLRKYMEAPEKETPNSSDKHDNKMDKLKNHGKFVGGYPRGIVVHMTDSRDVASFMPDWLREGIGAIIIKRCGTVLAPTDYLKKPFVMHHAGKSRWTHPGTGETYVGLSRYCIGIECVCERDGKLTKEQMRSLDTLVLKITRMYNIKSDWILGHSEVRVPKAARRYCPGNVLVDYVKDEDNPVQMNIKEYREYLIREKVIREYKEEDGSESSKNSGEPESKSGDSAKDDKVGSEEGTIHGLF